MFPVLVGPVCTHSFSLLLALPLSGFLFLAIAQEGPKAIKYPVPGFDRPVSFPSQQRREGRNSLAAQRCSFGSLAACALWSSPEPRCLARFHPTGSWSIGNRGAAAGVVQPIATRSFAAEHLAIGSTVNVVVVAPPGRRSGALPTERGLLRVNCSPLLPRHARRL